MGHEGLLNEHVQQTLMGEAVAAATVGFLVWDDDRRYIAVNDRACEILGCSLDEIVGASVGGRTHDGDELVADALRREQARGVATVDRFDGSGTVLIAYLTFVTRAAGLPYMASIIWPADEL